MKMPTHLFLRKFITIVFILVSGINVLYAQNSAADRYYQDRITSGIANGKTLLEEKEIEEGMNYLKEAIQIASERSHDYMAAIIVINEKAINPVVDYYYSVDSVAQARFYIDLHSDLYKRYPNARKQNKEIDDEQYAYYLSACYGLSAQMAQKNHDNRYTIKYHELYVENAKTSSQFRDELLVFSEDLINEYLNEEQYLDALSLSFELYDERISDGNTDEDSIFWARYVYNHIKAKAFSKQSPIPIADKANDLWLDFISRLYEEKGATYMDSLLMSMDQHEDWRDEIGYDMTATTMIAALMSRCSYALQMRGYDSAKKALFDFRDYLYQNGKSELWPIASNSFLDLLEYHKLHSATYSFCKSIESDFLSLPDILPKDLHYFYIYFIGACDRVGDFRKEFDICFNHFNSVKESDEYYWIVSRLKGSFFLQIGLFEDALICMKDALEHYHFPDEPRDGDVILYAGLYSYIGTAYRRLGKTEEAITYFQKSIELCDQYGVADQKLSPFFDLGRIYHGLGEWNKAKEYFLACAEIQLRTNAQYEISSPYSYLFDIERRVGNVGKARDFFSAMWQAHLKEYLSFKDYLTIQEQTSYWVKEGDIRFIGGAIAESSPDYNDLYYDMLLISKGFLLKSEVAEYNNVFGSGDQKLQDLYLATHSGRGHSQEEIDNYMALYRSHHFKSEIETMSWKTVQSKLSKNDLAIEFFQYELEDWEQGLQYGALLLKNGWKTPKFVHLCSEEELDRAINKTNNLYSADGLLYQLIWGPIDKELKGVKNVYFSPQGALHTINLSALLDSRGEPIYRRYNMYRVSSTQSIGNLSNTSVTRSFVYGGLIYDVDDETMIQEHRKYSYASDDFEIGHEWESDLSSTRRGWAYLPNTELEIDEITKLLMASGIEVNKYSGTSGTEESFKSISGTAPGIIHLATHGFYLQYSYADSTAIAQNHVKERAAVTNALIRSGLILSNGGRAWKGDKIPEGVEDGILQSDEISNINLAGTSLLVLSACETALGDISSDGVYGLQRAFKMAGVGTIIMSLWEVDDRATSLFMSYFYEAWTSGKNKHDAFVVAQDRLRQEYNDPYYWAAFIMLD